MGKGRLVWLSSAVIPAVCSLTMHTAATAATAATRVTDATTGIIIAAIANRCNAPLMPPLPLQPLPSPLPLLLPLTLPLLFPSYHSPPMLPLLQLLRCRHYYHCRPCRRYSITTSDRRCRRCHLHYYIITTSAPFHTPSDRQNSVNSLFDDAVSKSTPNTTLFLSLAVFASSTARAAALSGSPAAASSGVPRPCICSVGLERMKPATLLWAAPLVPKRPAASPPSEWPNTKTGAENPSSSSALATAADRSPAQLGTGSSDRSSHADIWLRSSPS